MLKLFNNIDKILSSPIPLVIVTTIIYTFAFSLASALTVLSIPNQLTLSSCILLTALSMVFLALFLLFLSMNTKPHNQAPSPKGPDMYNSSFLASALLRSGNIIIIAATKETHCVVPYGRYNMLSLLTKPDRMTQCFLGYSNLQPLLSNLNFL